MVIISHDAREAVLEVSYEDAVDCLEMNRVWIMNQLEYLVTHAPRCYTLIFGHSVFMAGLIQSDFQQIAGLDPLHVFHGEGKFQEELKDLRLKLTFETLDALYASPQESYGAALVNRSLEIMTSEQSRAAMIGLHKRLISRGRVLVVLERSLCAKQHLELLDDDYFEQLISPYFMIEKVEESQLSAVHYKVYQLRAI